MSDAQTNTFRDPAASLDWMRQIQAQQRRAAEENGVLRNLYKRAQAAGEDIKGMKLAIRMTKVAPEEAVAETKSSLYYMAIRNIPVTRESLFDGLDLHKSEQTRHDDDLWDAEEKGYLAGRHNVKIDECPYHPGAELHVKWVEWWNKGQAAIARELGPNAEQANASRRHPRQERMEGTEERQLSPRARKAAGPTSRKKPARKKGPSRRRNPSASRNGVLDENVSAH